MSGENSIIDPKNCLLFHFRFLVVEFFHFVDELFLNLGRDDTDSAASPTCSSEPTSKSSIVPGQLCKLIYFRAGTLIELLAGLLALVHELSQQFNFLLIILVWLANLDEIEDPSCLTEHMVSSFE